MSSHFIDLRSDTVTRPTPGMRAAIARAEVGDDQYGDDPCVNALQERIAALAGKERAIFLPSGTMANQVALRTLTRPGDDVIVSRESHAVWHEGGGSAANAGVQFTEIGANGRFGPAELVAAVKPRGHVIYPPTTLVEVENTHNRMGGVVIPLAEIDAICVAARERGIATFLDGARLWNASVASNTPIADFARNFDLVALALSKGLGCPAGTLLAGSAPTIAAAIRHRRMLGGAMRQSGFLAAAGLYALDHHVERLAEDHANARLIARRLAESPAIAIDPASVQTNILVFRLREGAPDAAVVSASAAAMGVRVFAFDARTVRAVTHLDVSQADCARAAEVLVAAAEGRTV